MAEDEWKARLKKWEAGPGDMAKITGDEVLDYMNTKIYEYGLFKSTDDNLWEAFKEDFKNFTTDTFGLIFYK